MKNVNMKVISLGLGVSMMMGGFSSCLVYPIKAAAGSVGASLPVSSTGLPTPPPLPASTGLPTPPPLPVSTGLPTPPPLPASTGLPTPPPASNKPVNNVCFTDLLTKGEHALRAVSTSGKSTDMHSEIRARGLSNKKRLEGVTEENSKQDGVKRLLEKKLFSEAERILKEKDALDKAISKAIESECKNLAKHEAEAKRKELWDARIRQCSDELQSNKEIMEKLTKECEQEYDKKRARNIEGAAAQAMSSSDEGVKKARIMDKAIDLATREWLKQQSEQIEKELDDAIEIEKKKAALHGTSFEEKLIRSQARAALVNKKRQEHRDRLIKNPELISARTMEFATQTIEKDYEEAKANAQKCRNATDDARKAISQENESLKEQVAELKVALSKANSENLPGAKQSSARENEIAQLKAELEEARNAAKEAEAKKNARENEIAQLKAELEKTKSTAIQEAAIAKTLKKSNEGLNAELRNAKDAIKRYGTELGKVIEEAGDLTATVEIDVARIKGLKENSEALTAKLGEVTKEAEKQTERIRTLETRNAQLNASRSNVFVETSNNAGNNGDSVAGVRITDMNLIDGVEYVPLQVNVAENKSDKLQQNAKVLVQLPEDERRNIREAVKMINENVKVSGDNNGLVIDGTFVGGSSVVVNKNDLVKYGKKIRVSFEVKNENTGMFEELGSQEIDTSRNLKINKLAGTMRMKVTPVA